MSLSTETMVRAVDALAAVVALLVEWGAHEQSEHKAAHMRAAQHAVATRNEGQVRLALAELCCILDELADSKDDDRTFRVVAAAHSALMAIQRDLVKNARGRMVA